jgi:hypothetical protein
VINQQNSFPVQKITVLSLKSEKVPYYEPTIMDFDRVVTSQTFWFVRIQRKPILDLLLTLREPLESKKADCSSFLCAAATNSTNQTNKAGSTHHLSVYFLNMMSRGNPKIKEKAIIRGTSPQPIVF